MFTCTHQLNTEQLKELSQLMAQCRVVDGSTPNVYPHLLKEYRSLPANALFYQEGQLIGFISVFFFYEACCEISLLVEPSYRKKGVARQLLESIMPLVHIQQVKKLIFSCPSQLNEDWLLPLGFEYQMSEYHMERYDFKPALVLQCSLRFSKATKDDITDLCLIDEACFPKEQSQMLARMHLLLNDRDYDIIIAYLDGNPVGKAHIRWKDGGATFSDIGILPLYQGNGLGASLLAHCINFALSEGKPRLHLDVETRNINALNLYIRLGFEVKNACDYWQITVDNLPRVVSN